jgi:uncharacterized phiE125 gp8 family phage protein
MKRKLTVRPSVAVISVAEAKARLAIDFGDDDLVIESYIAAATDYAEQYTGRAIMLQTWQYYFDSFACALLIYETNITSVSIKYYDENNTLQTLTDSYYLDNAAYPSRITPALRFPPTAIARPNSVIIDVVTGHADVKGVPACIVAAIALITGHLYNNRENSSDIELHEIPMGAKALMDMYRI